ncbi:hypothetical protein A0H81_14427 [Grifola frondosa]|uniref:DUF6699 domain-containing protein n=1 Tax=Grifola frondosa TaxID=5627 RepID=A0A1C7LLV3_GRIFR|nr:hypothetical protein A0H81_14427 [Grifola frondosa]
MTPPASPEKGSSAPRGARTAQAFHPLLAVRSARASPVRFELGRGAIDIANLRVNANDLRAYATAVPTAGLLVTVHDLFELPVYASNGSYVTVGDVINHLVTAMAAPLSSQEFARLQPRFHFTRNTSRVSLLDRTVMFAGLE